MYDTLYIDGKIVKAWCINYDSNQRCIGTLWFTDGRLDALKTHSKQLSLVRILSRFCLKTNFVSLVSHRFLAFSCPYATDTHDQLSQLNAFKCCTICASGCGCLDSARSYSADLPRSWRSGRIDLAKDLLFFRLLHMRPLALVANRPVTADDAEQEQVTAGSFYSNASSQSRLTIEDDRSRALDEQAVSDESGILLEIQVDLNWFKKLICKYSLPFRTR